MQSEEAEDDACRPYHEAKHNGRIEIPKTARVKYPNPGKVAKANNESQVPHDAAESLPSGLVSGCNGS